MKMYKVTLELSMGKGTAAVKETYVYRVPAASAEEAKTTLTGLLDNAGGIVLNSNTIWPLKSGATYKVKKVSVS